MVTICSSAVIARGESDETATSSLVTETNKALANSSYAQNNVHLKKYSFKEV